MSTIEPSDKFLVQRGENSHRTNASDLMSTIDTTKDWMLIQRGTNSFKVSAQDVKDQLGGGSGPGGDFSSVTIAPLSITPQVAAQTITCTTDIPKVDGSVPADVFWQWYFYDEATGDVGKEAFGSRITNRKTIAVSYTHLTLPTKQMV